MMFQKFYEIYGFLWPSAAKFYSNVGAKGFSEASTMFPETRRASEGRPPQAIFC